MNETPWQTLQLRRTRASNHLQMALWLLPVHIPFTLHLINNRLGGSTLEVQWGEMCVPVPHDGPRMPESEQASPLLTLT